MPRLVNKIYNADSRNISKVLPSAISIQTTITSPPYFDMKDYGVDGQVGFGQSYSAYVDDLASIFKQVLDRTSCDGTLWIIVDTFKRNGNVVMLPYDIAEKLKSVGWHLQNIIIWKKDKTVPWSSGGFVQRKFEYILFFSKSESYKSYGDRVRVTDTSKLKSWWVKYPERYNPKGKAMDEIWEFPIPVQGSWGKEYIRHFCPLPKEMVSTMIALSSDEGDIVFDPFSGTGTVPAEAAYMNRRYIGVELNPEYVEKSRSYIRTTLVSGRKNYLRELNFDSTSFEKTILSLRALKYGRLILNALEKELGMIGQLRVKVGNPYFEEFERSLSVPYTIYGTLDEQRAQAFLTAIVKKAPLSKFGIKGNFSFYNCMPSSLDGFFCYSRTNSHQYLKGARQKSAQIGIFSRLQVDIDEKDFQ